MVIWPILSVTAVPVSRLGIALSIAMMSTISAKTVADTTELILKIKKSQHFSVLTVACPYCGTAMTGAVHKTAQAYSYIASIANGREPFFGFELWFLTHFQGRAIWALNKEHLNYLIDYLVATQRQKPATYPLKTQSDHLPTFMKTAKNRERIVKLLVQMQRAQL